MPTDTGTTSTSSQTTPSLRVNVSWTLVGNLVYMACQWGMLVALAKLGNAKMVGQFALALAITTPVVTFANLGLRNIQATDAAHRFRWRDFLRLRATTTALAMVVVAVVVMAVGYPRGTSLVILLIAVAKGFEALSDLCYGVFLRHERLARMAASLVVKGIGSLVALAVVIAVTGSLVSAAAAMAAVWLLVLAAYDFPNALRLANNVTPDHGNAPASERRTAGLSTALLKEALPLGVATLLIALSNNLTQYFVEHHGGEEQLGYFAAVAYFGVAARRLVATVSQTASPRLANYYVVGNRTAFSRLLVRLLGAAVALGLLGLGVALVAGEGILALFYRREFGEFHGLLVLLMGATTVRLMGTMLNAGVLAMQRFRALPAVFGTVTVVGTIAAVVLVPAHGLYGAAWTEVAIGVLHLGGTAWIVVRTIHRSE